MYKFTIFLHTLRRFLFTLTAPLRHRRIYTRIHQMIRRENPEIDPHGVEMRARVFALLAIDPTVPQSDRVLFGLLVIGLFTDHGNAVPGDALRRLIQDDALGSKFKASMKRIGEQWKETPRGQALIALATHNTPIPNNI